MCSELEYSLKRLVRGLASNRKAARHGYFVTLTEVYKINVTVNQACRYVGCPRLSVNVPINCFPCIPNIRDKGGGNEGLEGDWKLGARGGCVILIIVQLGNGYHTSYKRQE